MDLRADNFAEIDCLFYYRYFDSNKGEFYRFVGTTTLFYENPF